ncbi:MAG: FliA/WhiG family polymerase sigma factor [Acidobacteriaceae bacterium]|nr:FliA/WhiG family polymerase sigma factor [Acidobacteriaceae bacterium]
MQRRTTTSPQPRELPVSLSAWPVAFASTSTAAGPSAPPARTKTKPGGTSMLGSTLSEESLREHLPMVRFLAIRIRERLPQQVELEDLISAGIVGLLDAFQKFDLAKKVQFRTYAQFRVRGAMLDSLRALDWGPRDLRRKGRAVEEAIRSLSSKLGKAPTESEIAEEMSLSLGEYQQLLGELSGLELSSLNALPADDNGVEALALLPAGPEDDPFLRCQSNEMRSLLADAIEELPERERLVLTLYYYEELTMKEVGATLGVVESRVSQLHSSAMARLRVALGAKRGIHRA